MGRAAGDEEIHRQDACSAIAGFAVAKIGPAGERAGAYGDHQLGRRQSGVGLLQRQLHIGADAAGDQQAIGVTWRGDKLDAEAAQIENYRAQNVYVRFAGIAAGGADLAQPERAAIELEHFGFQSASQLQRFAVILQRFARTHRQAKFAREPQGARGAGFSAFAAKQAAPQIQAQIMFLRRKRNRVNGASFLAVVATGPAQLLVKGRPAPEMLRQFRFFAGEW